ncbi:MAG: hypothetical protein QM779_02945 [Propionicimonas sp.]|uniref:hypothetical protein n=1 Tax=Propionicimonas sp. TaxID=1955623 RepID=UPI003D0D609D
MVDHSDEPSAEGSSAAPARFVEAAFASESAVYGVVLVSGLLVIVANQSDAELDEVLLKVLGTSAVFWLAHVYSAAFAELGQDPAPGSAAHPSMLAALGHALRRSWGLLGSAIVPTIILGLGVLGLIAPTLAIWGTLWIDVAILAALGYWSVSRWSSRVVVRLVGAFGTALLGVALIMLKALIH